MKQSSISVLTVIVTVFTLMISTSSAEDSQFLPKSIPGGFSLKEPVTFFNAGNLYEYINGQAVFYLSYKFVRLEHGYYGKGDATYYVDVYELGSPLSAFGSYRQQREIDAESLGSGSEGAVTDYLTVFCKDKYYVEIIPMDSGDDDIAAMKQLAAAVASKIPGDETLPGELALFPGQGLVSGSERYVDENLISYSFMGRGMVAHYTIEGQEEEVRVFIAMPPDAETANTIFDEYLTKLEKTENVPLGNATAHIGSEQYRGTTIVARWNNYVFGCLDVKNMEKSQAILKSLLGNLEK